MLAGTGDLGPTIKNTPVFCPANCWVGWSDDTNDWKCPICDVAVWTEDDLAAHVEFDRVFSDEYQPEEDDIVW